MTPLERNRLLSALGTNGYHAETPAEGDWIGVDSTFARGRCYVAAGERPDEYLAAISLPEVANALAAEGYATTASLAAPAGTAPTLFNVVGNDALHRLVRRIYQLSLALPTAPLEAFAARTRGMSATTEAERLVRERIGQGIFRNALMEYWSGRCAATGIEQPELLRASHCKPWEDSNDAERLDVHNGLLLAADVDAAFDSGLIAFEDDGRASLSGRLQASLHARFAALRLAPARLLTDAHRGYLAWHRRHRFLCERA